MLLWSDVSEILQGMEKNEIQFVMFEEKERKMG